MSFSLQNKSAQAVVNSEEAALDLSSTQHFGRYASSVSDGERAARIQLLQAVQAISGTLNAGASQSDREGRLCKESVQALTSHNLWRMRLCTELGGLELPIATQIEVLSALAAEDTSSAWCTMVANNGLAVLGATMPEAAVERIFAGGVPRCTIVASPSGSATPTDGGFTLNGTWRLASSIQHAQWVYATAFVERDPSRLLPLAVPVQDVELLETWNVVGLAGTGSKDFKLTDYFLPAELAGREHAPFAQVRGIRRYDLVDVEFLESYEHLAFALGVMRRSLRELHVVFSMPLSGRYVSEREVVESEMGKALVQLQALEALTYSVFDRIDAAAFGELKGWSESERYLPRALASWATKLALECVQFAFHRAGMMALGAPNIFEKLLRDMSVAANHVVVNDVALPAYTQHLIELGTPLDFRPRTLTQREI